MRPAQPYVKIHFALFQNRFFVVVRERKKKELYQCEEEEKLKWSI